jgi:hypothetical protein
MMRTLHSSITVLALLILFGTEILHAQQEPGPNMRTSYFVQTGILLTSWSEVKDATAYMIDIAIDSTFRTILPGLENKEVYPQFDGYGFVTYPPNNRQTLIGHLTEYTRYYVRVRARTPKGLTLYSATSIATITLNGQSSSPIFFNVAQSGNYRTIIAEWNNLPSTSQFTISFGDPAKPIVYDSFNISSDSSSGFVRKVFSLSNITESTPIACTLSLPLIQQKRVRKVFNLPAKVWDVVQRFEEVPYYQTPLSGDSTYYSYNVRNLPFGKITKTSVDSLILLMTQGGLLIDTVWFREAYILDYPGNETSNSILVVKLRQATNQIYQYGPWTSASTDLFQPRRWLFEAEQSIPIRYIFKNPSTAIALKDALAMTVTPNPSSDVALLSWQQPFPSEVQFSLVDVLGQEVRSVAVGFLAAGQQNFSLSTRELPAGVYTVRLQSGGRTQTGRLMVVR